ncbi:hypothetical protein ACS5PK_01240 [Roseateles sp. DB2]|uniref:hypothetical protein n=1 Tax=Roseateles sp. DB2 TaxID=3453717 RepID=UPI003EE843C8
MWHLSLAWLWVMAGLIIGLCPLRSVLYSWWTVAVLILALLLWRRGPWRGLLRPRRGVRVLCWAGHALMLAATLLLLSAGSSLMEGAHGLGLGLLVGLLLLPLPFIGAAAWLCQLAQLWRQAPLSPCPAPPGADSIHKR